MLCSPLIASCNLSNSFNHSRQWLHNEHHADPRKGSVKSTIAVQHQLYFDEAGDAQGHIESEVNEVSEFNLSANVN